MLFDAIFNCRSKSNVLTIFGIIIRTVWTNCHTFYFESGHFYQEKRGIDRTVPIQNEEIKSMPLMSERNMLEGVQITCFRCMNGIY